MVNVLNVLAGHICNIAEHRMNEFMDVDLRFNIGLDANELVTTLKLGASERR